MKRKAKKSAADWIRSKEGRKTVREALEAVEESEYKLRLARMVKPEDLRRTIDV